MHYPMTTARVTATALLALMAIGLPGCDDSASSESSAPAATAAAPAPDASTAVSTMAMSELARWQVEGFNEALTAEMQAIHGVEVLQTDAEAQTVLFKWSPSHTSEAAIQSALTEKGYTVTPLTTAQGQVAYRIDAPKLHCGACVKGVQGVVLEIEGVELDRISVGKHLVTIRFSPDVTTPEAVIEALNQAGFAAQPSAAGTGVDGQAPSEDAADAPATAG